MDDKIPSLNCNVSIRIKPLNENEIPYSTRLPVHYDLENNNIILVNSNQQYKFDYVFGPAVSQQYVFSECCEPLIKAFFKGYNCCIFSYGQTGSGKTYTMGNNYSLSHEIHETTGIIPRAIKQIFDELNNYKSQMKTKPLLTVSYIEVYNEVLRDLLHGAYPDSKSTTKGGGKSIRIFEDPHNKCISIIGAETIKIHNLDELLDCLCKGSIRRSTAANSVNSTSSRSHAVFTVNMSYTTNETITSKFHFIDLAGSERIKKTKSEGLRLKEGISINSGLLALSNVINSLTSNYQSNINSQNESNQLTKQDSHSIISYVPYRHSKLTRILQDSLGGNSRTCMIACISLKPTDVNETYNSIRYAARVRSIQNIPIVNPHSNFNTIEDYQRQINELTMQLISLRRQDISRKSSLSTHYNMDSILSSLNSNCNPKLISVKQLRSIIKLLRQRLRNHFTQLFSNISLPLPDVKQDINSCHEFISNSVTSEDIPGMDSSDNSEDPDPDPDRISRCDSNICLTPLSKYAQLPCSERNTNNDPHYDYDHTPISQTKALSLNPFKVFPHKIKNLNRLDNPLYELLREKKKISCKTSESVDVSLKKKLCNEIKKNKILKKDINQRKRQYEKCSRAKMEIEQQFKSLLREYKVLKEEKNKLERDIQDRDTRYNHMVLRQENIIDQLKKKETKNFSEYKIKYISQKYQIDNYKTKYKDLMRQFNKIESVKHKLRSKLVDISRRGKKKYIAVQAIRIDHIHSSNPIRDVDQKLQNSTTSRSTCDFNLAPLKKCVHNQITSETILSKVILANPLSYTKSCFNLYVLNIFQNWYNQLSELDGSTNALSLNHKNYSLLTEDNNKCITYRDLQNLLNQIYSIMYCTNNLFRSTQSKSRRNLFRKIKFTKSPKWLNKILREFRCVKYSQFGYSKNISGLAFLRWCFVSKCIVIKNLLILERCISKTLYSSNDDQVNDDVINKKAVEGILAKLKKKFFWNNKILNFHQCIQYYLAELIDKTSSIVGIDINDNFKCYENVSIENSNKVELVKNKNRHTSQNDANDFWKILSLNIIKNSIKQLKNQHKNHQRLHILQSEIPIVPKNQSNPTQKIDNVKDVNVYCLNNLSHSSAENLVESKNKGYLVKEVVNTNQLKSKIPMSSASTEIVNYDSKNQFANHSSLDKNIVLCNKGQSTQCIVNRSSIDESDCFYKNTHTQMLEKFRVKGAESKKSPCHEDALIEHDCRELIEFNCTDHASNHYRYPKKLKYIHHTCNDLKNSRELKHLTSNDHIASYSKNTGKSKDDLDFKDLHSSNFEIIVQNHNKNDLSSSIVLGDSTTDQDICSMESETFRFSNACSNVESSGYSTFEMNILNSRHAYLDEPSEICTIYQEQSKLSFAKFNNCNQQYINDKTVCISSKYDFDFDANDNPVFACFDTNMFSKQESLLLVSSSNYFKLWNIEGGITNVSKPQRTPLGSWSLLDLKCDDIIKSSLCRQIEVVEHGKLYVLAIDKHLGLVDTRMGKMAYSWFYDLSYSSFKNNSPEATVNGLTSLHFDKFCIGASGSDRAIRIFDLRYTNGSTIYKVPVSSDIQCVNHVPVKLTSRKQTQNQNDLLKGLLVGSCDGVVQIWVDGWCILSPKHLGPITHLQSFEIVDHTAFIMSASLDSRLNFWLCDLSGPLSSNYPLTLYFPFKSPIRCVSNMIKYNDADVYLGLVGLENAQLSFVYLADNQSTNIPIARQSVSYSDINNNNNNNKSLLGSENSGSVHKDQMNSNNTCLTSSSRNSLNYPLSLCLSENFYVTVQNNSNKISLYDYAIV